MRKMRPMWLAVRAPRQASAVPADPAPTKGFAWARIDGQLLSGSPERTAQARSDIAGCKAETPPTAAEGVPGEECGSEDIIFASSKPHIGPAGDHHGFDRGRGRVRSLSA